MEQLKTYQCPACNGGLTYSARTGRLECEYCGSSFTVAEMEAAAAPKLTCFACGTELKPGSGDITCPKCGAEYEAQALKEYAAQKAAGTRDQMDWDVQAGDAWL